MTESELQGAVIDLAITCGWRVHHARPALTAKGWRTPISGHAGFPDLVLAHPHHGLLVVELKAERGRLSPEQQAWLDVLAAARVDVAVWRPTDWSEVVAVLSAGRAAA